MLFKDLAEPEETELTNALNIAGVIVDALHTHRRYSITTAKVRQWAVQVRLLMKKDGATLEEVMFVANTMQQEYYATNTSEHPKRWRDNFFETYDRLQTQFFYHTQPCQLVPLKDRGRAWVDNFRWPKPCTPAAVHRAISFQINLLTPALGHIGWGLVARWLEALKEEYATRPEYCPKISARRVYVVPGAGLPVVWSDNDLRRAFDVAQIRKMKKWR